jgi:hypothetical protein
VAAVVAFEPTTASRSIWRRANCAPSARACSSGISVADQRGRIAAAFAASGAKAQR